MRHLHLSHLSYAWPGQAEPLLIDLSLTHPDGWLGVVGANGRGKTTLMRLIAGELSPGSGTIRTPGRAFVCDQRTDEPPPDFLSLFSEMDGEMARLCNQLAIGADWPWRWDTLSHGERRRSWIAVALASRPDLLLIDEPTNHVDIEARALIVEALVAWRGAGLVVSHDRDLLDRLCSQTLFLEPDGRAVVRPGGVTAGEAEAERERLAAARSYRALALEHTRLEREASRRRAHAAQQDRRRSKRGLARGDSDAREKIDRARITGADGTAGRLFDQLDGRRAQVAEALADAQRPVRLRTGVSVVGRRAQRAALMRLCEGELTLGDGRTVGHSELVVGPSDRIAIVGPNGAGKTTLLNALLADATADVLAIPQELTAERTRELARELGAMAPAVRARVLSTVSRLGSSPTQVLSTTDPSPGEARKLMLAMGLEREPELIVMDEPTNHLDLTSIRCLVDALADVACALVIVSHDPAFVEAVAKTTWRVSDGWVHPDDGTACND